MHELVDLGHSMTHAAVGLCRDETRTSEHIGISPAEEGWTVANDNERYLVAALTCNVLQHNQQFTLIWRPEIGVVGELPVLTSFFSVQSIMTWVQHTYIPHAAQSEICRYETAPNQQ
jgi:hypothetical protein